MKILDSFIELIKKIFTRDKHKALLEKNEVINEIEEKQIEEQDEAIDITEDSKKLFHSFKISTEVLELALEYEKKKKEVEDKEREIRLLDTEIISLTELSKKLDRKNS